MKRWDPQQIAHACGAELLHAPPELRGGPQLISIDSRDAAPGVLFVGLPGERVHGGDFAGAALAAGAWGVLSTPQHTRGLSGGVVLAAQDPLAALQKLAGAWRRELGASVIGVTGSTGKTSTKDLLRAVLAPQRRTVASRQNFNTEIGLPLQILSAEQGTEVLVLEMAMRGAGQIAQLAAIAQPDVGVIVNIAPVHLEQLGSLEAIAAAKAELLAALPPGATAVVPAVEPLLEPHLREDLEVLRFGAGGDVQLVAETEHEVTVQLLGERLRLGVNFAEAHLRQNLLAAVAAAHAVGVRAGGAIELERAAGRGERHHLPGSVTLFDDCYNANPASMRAALTELGRNAQRARSSGSVRTVAVLGDMLELGPDAAAYHAQIGSHADAVVDVLVTVGPLAAGMAAAFHAEHHHAHDAAQAAQLLPALLAPGDLVLVKGSNGVGLRLVCDTLLGTVAA